MNYDTHRFFLRLSRGLLLCACFAQAINAFGGSGAVIVTNAANMQMRFRVYTYNTNNSTWEQTTISSLYAYQQWVQQWNQGYWKRVEWRDYATQNVLQTDTSPNPMTLDDWTSTWTGSAPPTTTNTCQASLTIFNTEATAESKLSQHWRVFWLDSTAGSPYLRWDGYLAPGATMTFNEKWDIGSGHCPGQLSAVGDRWGYDTPTNLFASSTNGTRDLTPPSGNSPETTGSPGAGGTNQPTTGDLSKLLGELQKLGKEGTLEAETNLSGQISGKLSQLHDDLTTINGTLQNGGFGSSVAKEATQQATTNLLGQANQQLAGISNVINMGRAPTNYDEFMSRADAHWMFGMSNAASANESAQASNPWGAGNAFTNAGVWHGKMSGMEDGLGGTMAGTNGIPGGAWVGETETNTDWLSCDLPGLVLMGVATRNWSWGVTPALPSGADSSAFKAVIGLIYLTWCAGISIFLWWDIRADIQKHICFLAMIPQAQSSGTTISGVNLGGLGRAIAAAGIIACIYTFGAHLVGWLSNAMVEFGEWSFYDIKSAAESGTVGGFYSVWIPRVLYWVAQAFPFALAFGAMSMWVTYQMTRDSAVRLAMVVLKKVGGLLVLPFLLLSASESRAAVLYDGGSVGSVTVSSSYTGAVGVVYGGNTWWMGTNVVGSWTVPAGIDGIMTESGTSNGVSGVWDQSSVFIDTFGNVTVARSDIVPRERGLLWWGTTGVVCGVFFGFLSCVGFVFRRGLFQPGRWQSGGE